MSHGLQLLTILLASMGFVWLMAYVVYLAHRSQTIARLGREQMWQRWEEMRKVIRTDAAALQIIEEFRRQFSNGPIRHWTDCIDAYMGDGFSGLTGHFAETIFTGDGRGRWVNEDETILFEWRSAGVRTLEIRCLEHIPPLEDCTEEELAEDKMWHCIEFDFVVPRYVGQPVIFDFDPAVAHMIQDGTLEPYGNIGFLQCFGY